MPVPPLFLKQLRLPELGILQELNRPHPVVPEPVPARRPVPFRHNLVGNLSHKVLAIARVATAKADAVFPPPVDLTADRVDLLVCQGRPTDEEEVVDPTPPGRVFRLPQQSAVAAGRFKGDRGGAVLDLRPVAALRDVTKLVLVVVDNQDVMRYLVYAHGSRPKNLMAPLVQLELFPFFCPRELGPLLCLTDLDCYFVHGGISDRREEAPCPVVSVGNLLVQRPRLVVLPEGSVEEMNGELPGPQHGPGGGAGCGTDAKRTDRVAYRGNMW
jgi:hypothetical protein